MAKKAKSAYQVNLDNREQARKHLLNHYTGSDTFTKVLHAYLGFMSPKCNLAWASYSTIAKKVHKSERTVRASLKAAELIGVLPVAYTSLKAAYQHNPALRDVIGLDYEQNLVVRTYDTTHLLFATGEQPLPADQITIIKETQRRQSVKQAQGNSPVVDDPLPEAVAGGNSPVVDDHTSPVVDDHTSPVVDDHQNGKTSFPYQEEKPPLFHKDVAGGKTATPTDSELVEPIVLNPIPANNVANSFATTGSDQPGWEEEEPVKYKWGIPDLGEIERLAGLRSDCRPSLLRDLDQIFPRTKIQPRDLAAVARLEYWDTLRQKFLGVYLTGNCRDTFIEMVHQEAERRRLYQDRLGNPIKLFHRTWHKTITFTKLEMLGIRPLEPELEKVIACLYLNQYGLQDVHTEPAGFFLELQLPPLTDELFEEFYPAWRNQTELPDCDLQLLLACYQPEEHLCLSSV